MAMEIIKLEELNVETFSNFADFNNQLKPGIYHITNFWEMYHPTRFKRIAYLQCLEGKFYTVSSPIVYDLTALVGESMRKALDRNPERAIRVEVVRSTNKIGRIWGLVFRTSDKLETNVAQD